jgi:hypothetical protein
MEIVAGKREIGKRWIEMESGRSAALNEFAGTISSIRATLFAVVDWICARSFQHSYLRNSSHQASESCIPANH